MNTEDFERISKELRPQTELRFKRGEDSLLVRQTGAVIRRLKLNNVEVLTTGTQLDPDRVDQPMKIDAAHTMLPVGPSNLGTQHGASRYLEYAVEESTGSAVRLHATDPLRNLGHTKTLKLEDGSAVIIDDVENLNDGEVDISLGEHFYFKVAEGDLGRIRLLEQDGGATLLHGRGGEGEVFEGQYADTVTTILGGGTVHVENFTGSQIFEIPGMGTVKLVARATTFDGELLPVDLHIWHRPGSDTVAFEPVVGFWEDDEGAHNDGIKLRAGERLVLRSEISLV